MLVDVICALLRETESQRNITQITDNRGCHQDSYDGYSGPQPSYKCVLTHFISSL